MSEPTTIQLGPHDAAFVLRADGTTEMLIPDLDSDEVAPKHVEEATMLAYVLDDLETREYVRRRWVTVVESEDEDGAARRGG